MSHIMILTKTNKQHKNRFFWLFRSLFLEIFNSATAGLKSAD